MGSVGERLKIERERLGYSQEAFGETCGVKKRSQINYEKNERNPDALYLIKAGDLGADVSFILTGIPAGSGIVKDSGAIKSANRTGIESDDLVDMLSLIAEAMQAAEIDPADKEAVNKLLEMYLELSLDQTYRTRDEAGQKRTKSILMLFARSIA